MSTASLIALVLIPSLVSCAIGYVAGRHGMNRELVYQRRMAGKWWMRYRKSEVGWDDE